MDKIRYIISILWLSITLGQIPCTTAISPNPNFKGPSTKDWEQEFMQWYPNTGIIPDRTLKSPFYAPDNENVLPIVSGGNLLDFKEEDGWVLVAKRMGYSTSDGRDDPFFVLYNIHTGVLRIFINNTSSNDKTYKGVRLRTSNDKNQTGLFCHSLATSLPLDKLPQDAIYSQVNKAANGHITTPKFWMMADFLMAYDPCVCGKPDRYLTLELLSYEKFNANLEFSGAIEELTLYPLQLKKDVELEKRKMLNWRQKSRKLPNLI